MTTELTPTSSPSARRAGNTRQGAFVTTQWSAVLQAGRNDTTHAQTALEQLCSRYWPPLYAYVRRKGSSREEAEDLTQAFFAQFLKQNSFSRADPARGRFRSFLLASLKHFLANEWEKARSLKRGGGVLPLPLDFDSSESLAVQPAAPGDTPERAYDRQWALAVLETVLGALRQEYVDSGREDLFQVLKETLSGGGLEISYRDLGKQLGLSEGALKVAAHRLRKRYRELLREEIANTVAGSDEVEEELRELFAALS